MKGFELLMSVGILALEASPLIILVVIQRRLLKSNAKWKRVLLPICFGLLSIFVTYFLTRQFFNQPKSEFNNLILTIFLYLGLFNIPTLVLLMTDGVVKFKQQRRMDMIRLEVRDLN